MLPFRDRNPSGDKPWMTWTLIAANVLVFMSYWPLGTDDSVLRIYQAWGMTPANIAQGQGLHGFVTGMFIHGGFFHLALNMLFLHIFGDNMEAELGRLRFLGLYLFAGVLANLMQFVAAVGSPVPVGGASGAVAGVMGGYFLMFPRARVDVALYLIITYRIVAIPAWVLLSLWFALQLAGGLSTQANATSVAFWAHIGGFLAGVMLTARPWQSRGGVKFWSRFHGLPPHPEAGQQVPVVRRRGTQLPPPQRRGLFDSTK